MLPFGPAREVLSRIDLIRLNNTVLDAAGALLPTDSRRLDASHLATARRRPQQVRTCDERIADAAPVASA
jgi:hypothetical protein